MDRLITDNDEDLKADKIAKDFISDKRKEKIKRELQELMDDELYNLEDYAATHISETAMDMAKRFIEKVLDGDETAAICLFDCGRSSRYKSMGYDEGEPWCSLIHGSLFETSAIKLRRKLVETHKDLLMDERIKDLESIEKGLTLQVQNLEQKLQDSYSRLR